MVFGGVVREKFDIYCDWLNHHIGDSKVGEFFCLKQRRSTFTQECRAGTVTFLTMAYILAVNANILSDTGGTCSPADCTGPNKDPHCIYDDPGYINCVQIVKQDLVTATAAASLIGCVVMGLGANMPLGLAPGMGLNAYFTYNLVGYRGTGNVSYQVALAAIFIEGWIFILLAVTGVRAKIIQLVPRSIMLATSAGIGLFLAFVGLQNAQGLGLSTFSGSTLVTLGGCPASEQSYVYVSNMTATQICAAGDDPTINLGPPSIAYSCNGHRMQSASMWLGVAGFLLVAVLMQRRVKGAIMIGIVFVTVIAWIPNHAASYFGAKSSVQGGEARLEYFKKVVQVPSVGKTGLALDFSGLGNGQVWLAIFTFLYVDFLDTTGTLFSMANFMNNFIPGFVNENKQFPRQQFAFVTDGVATVAASLMGSSPVSTYIESAAGIREGGRTGITALVTALCFFIALFFTPILASIPPYAVGPALIIVGALMVANIAKIPWDRIGQAIPAFLTLAAMPLTYSIAYGVIAGLVSYVVINGANALLDYIGYYAGRLVAGKQDDAAADGSSHGPNPATPHFAEFSLHVKKGTPQGSRITKEGSGNPFLSSKHGTPGASMHGASAHGVRTADDSSVHSNASNSNQSFAAMFQALPSQQALRLPQQNGDVEMSNGKQ